MPLSRNALWPRDSHPEPSGIPGTVHHNRDGFHFLIISACGVHDNMGPVSSHLISPTQALEPSPAFSRPGNVEDWQNAGKAHRRCRRRWLATFVYRKFQRTSEDRLVRHDRICDLAPKIGTVRNYREWNRAAFSLREARLRAAQLRNAANGSRVRSRRRHALLGEKIPLGGPGRSVA